MLTGIPADAIVGIDPAGIIAYLRASGWREAGNYGQAAVWTQPVDGAEAEVLVPVSAGIQRQLVDECVGKGMQPHIPKARPLAGVHPPLLTPRSMSWDEQAQRPSRAAALRSHSVTLVS